jgi:hypothetical protein
VNKTKKLNTYKSKNNLSGDFEKVQQVEFGVFHYNFYLFIFVHYKIRLLEFENKDLKKKLEIKENNLLKLVKTMTEVLDFHEISTSASENNSNQSHQ